MLVEEEILDFEPALLEEPGFPWRGLVGSLVVHSIIVPLLAIGIQQVKRPQLTDEQMRIASVLKRQVIILRLPAELMKKRILPKEPERLKVEVKTAPVEPAKAARKVVKAFLMPAAKPRLQTSAAMILQPLVLTMQPAKLPEMEMPTITMVSPTPPKKRIVFDVGSLQQKPSMPKIVDPGTLPEPPQITVSSAPIRPLYTGVVNPKLPVYLGPPSMQTIEVKDKSSFSAGGPIVEAPTNVVMISSKPVPAREIVTVAGVIAMPKGGIGTGNLEDGEGQRAKGWYRCAQGVR